MHRDDHRTPYAFLSEEEKRRMMDPLGSRDIGAEGMARLDDLMTPRRPGPTLDLGLEFDDPGPLFMQDPATEFDEPAHNTQFLDPGADVDRDPTTEGSVEDSIFEKATGLDDGDLGIGVEKELGSLDGL